MSNLIIALVVVLVLLVIGLMVRDRADAASGALVASGALAGTSPASSSGLKPANPIYDKITGDPLYRRAADIRNDSVSSYYSAVPNFGMTAGDEDAQQPHSWSYFPDKPETRSVLYSTADVDPIVTGQLYAWRDNTRDIYGARTAHGDKYGLAEYSSGVPGEVGVDVGPLGFKEYAAPAFPLLDADGNVEHYGGVEWSRDVGLDPSGLVLPSFDDPNARPNYALAQMKYDYNNGYQGRSLGYNDGIPENWRFPSTPVRWYGPRHRDYYGPEGPFVANQYGPTFGPQGPPKRKLYSLTEPDHDPEIGADPYAEPQF